MKIFAVETQHDQGTKDENMDAPECAVVKTESKLLKDSNSDHDTLPIPEGNHSLSSSTRYITLADDGCPVNEPQDVWVTHDNLSLSLTDKAVMEQGEQLTDKHMQMAQYLAKRQFPLAGGLKSTLLQQKGAKGHCTANTIQIVHCEKRKHWIVASTIFARKGCVNIYDTLFARLDSETRTTIKRMFTLKSVEGLNMVDMQCQKGASDCGLFAIAVMTSLLFSEDPAKVTYKQDKLREHLKECFTVGKLSLFPKE